jgi:hypothetical protein
LLKRALAGWARIAVDPTPRVLGAVANWPAVEHYPAFVETESKKAIKVVQDDLVQMHAACIAAAAETPALEKQCSSNHLGWNMFKSSKNLVSLWLG